MTKKIKEDMDSIAEHRDVVGDKLYTVALLISFVLNVVLWPILLGYQVLNVIR